MKKGIFFGICLLFLLMSISHAEQALKLNGIDAYLDAGDKLSFQFGKRDFSIELWFYFDGEPQAGSLISKRSDEAPYNQYMINIGTDAYAGGDLTGRNIYGFIRPDNGLQFNDRMVVSNELSKGWHHVAMVQKYDTVLELYLDGIFVASSNIHHDGKPVNISGYPLMIGKSTVPKFFKGTIDEVRIWDYALSQTKIKVSMRRELTGDENGLLAYYNFNDPISDGIVKDLSPNGNHGRIVGNATLTDMTPPLTGEVPNDDPITIETGIEVPPPAGVTKPAYPPDLVVEDLKFVEPSGNRSLDAYETAEIRFNLHNYGRGDAQNIRINLTSPLASDEGISYTPIKILDDLPAKSHQLISFKLMGKPEIKTIPRNFQIQITEEFGFDTDPFNISFESQSFEPPQLKITDIRFIEPSGNGALDAYETGEIRFTLHNYGKSEAKNVQINLSSLTSESGIDYNAYKSLERLSSKSQQDVSFSIFGKPSVETLTRKFQVQITEEFGFDAEPVNITFDTKAYEPPDIEIEQLTINDKKEGDAYGNGNGLIEPGESIEVMVTLENIGSGPAEELKAKVLLATSDRNITYPDAGEIKNLGTIGASGSKTFKFYFYTSRRYKNTEIPIKLKLEEAKGLYDKTVDLGLKLKANN